MIIKVREEWQPSFLPKECFAILLISVLKESYGLTNAAKVIGQEVKRIGGEFFSFESDKQEDEIRMEVSQWLQELPKPVALFCCDDAHALFISETCRMNNIHIPEEIALLGVDNDELMCNISDPPISSIDLK